MDIFPEYDTDDLREYLTGDYQIGNALKYHEHSKKVKPMIHPDYPSSIRLIGIQSRFARDDVHTKRRTVIVRFTKDDNDKDGNPIDYVIDNPLNGIRYQCSCMMGNVTVSPCSHTTYVLYCIAHHTQRIDIPEYHPLCNKRFDYIIDCKIDQSDDEDDTSVSNDSDDNESNNEFDIDYENDSSDTNNEYESSCEYYSGISETPSGDNSDDNSSNTNESDCNHNSDNSDNSDCSDCSNNNNGSDGSDNSDAAEDSRDDENDSNRNDDYIPIFIPHSHHLTHDDDIKQNHEWKDSLQHCDGMGLKKLKNACFMNASLQSLANIPLLYQTCIQNGNQYRCHARREFCCLNEISKLFDRMMNGTTTYANPQTVYNNLHNMNENLLKGRQNHAHECVRAIVNSLELCEKNHKDLKLLFPSMDQTTWIFKIFGFYLKSSIKCNGRRCRFERDKFDPAMDLSITLPETDEVISLFDLIDDWFNAEKMEDEDYRCPWCKRKGNTDKKMKIFAPPNVLCIALKRFEYNLINNRRKKIASPVEFKEKLDLTDYCQVLESSFTAKYELNSVIEHIGSSANSGHYKAFVKAPSGKWYERDDQISKEVTVNDVLAINPYILFYTRTEMKQTTNYDMVRAWETEDISRNNCWLCQEEVELKDCLQCPRKECNNCKENLSINADLCSICAKWFT